MTPEFDTWRPLLSAGTRRLVFPQVSLTKWILLPNCTHDCQPFPRLVSRLFYDCDQGQADPVVAIARDQSSVYLQLLMHETQPPSQLTVSTITRFLLLDVSEMSLPWHQN